MLTKNDLDSIRVVVREEVKSELIPVRKDIKNLQLDMTVVKKDVKNLQLDMTVVKKDVKNLQLDMTVVKKDVKKLRKDLDKTINFFNKVNMSTRSEVNNTRKDLGLNEVEFAY